VFCNIELEEITNEFFDASSPMIHLSPKIKKDYSFLVLLAFLKIF